MGQFKRYIIVIVLLAIVIAIVEQFLDYPWFTYLILLWFTGIVLGQLKYKFSYFFLGALATAITFLCETLYLYNFCNKIIFQKVANILFVNTFILIIGSTIFFAILGGLSLYVGYLSFLTYSTLFKSKNRK